MSSISQFINYLYCSIYSSYILHKNLNKFIQEPDWPFVSCLNLESLCFACSHSLSFVAPLAVIRCPSLSFVAIRCHLLSLVVNHCTTRCHSFSFVVTCFRSFSLVVALVVSRCHSMYYSSVFL